MAVSAEVSTARLLKSLFFLPQDSKFSLPYVQTAWGQNSGLMTRDTRHVAGDTHRLARAQAVLHVALEDDAVGLGEPEGLVHALQRRALGGEPREDGGVHRAAILVDDWEGGPGVLGHGDTVPEGDTMQPAPRVVARLVTNVP